MSSQTFDDAKLVKQIFDQQGPMNAEIGKTVQALADYAPQIKQNTERMMGAVPESKRYKLREQSDKVIDLIGKAYKEFNTYKSINQKRNILGEYMPKIEDKGVFQSLIMSHPAYANEVRSPKDVVKLYNRLNKQENEYASKFKKVWGELLKNSESLNNMTKQYAAGMEHKTTKGEEAVLIGFAGAFASVVVYFLASMNPALIANSLSDVASPLPLAVMSGAVLLFLFFATHHKLHK